MTLCLPIYIRVVAFINTMLPSLTKKHIAPDNRPSRKDFSSSNFWFWVVMLVAGRVYYIAYSKVLSIDWAFGIGKMVIHDRPEDLKSQQEKRLELDAILYLVDDVETLFVCIWFSRPIHYYYHLLIVCFFQLLDVSIRACKTVHPSFLILFCCWEAGFAPDSVAATFTTHHQPFALLGCLLCSRHSEDGKFGALLG